VIGLSQQTPSLGLFEHRLGTALTQKSSPPRQPTSFTQQYRPHNRYPLHSTLGEPKVDVMARRVCEINPDCRLVALDRFISAEGCPDLLDPGLDLVVDTIDSLSCKVELIAQCMERNLVVLSSMGAGGRIDPTPVRVGDLMDTQVCPLARAVRTRIRRRGLGRGIQVVWSDEEPRSPLPPQDTGQGGPLAVNGTLNYVPAIFGLTLAGLAVQRLLGNGGEDHPGGETAA
jgi:tRNA A37 threonylcarbamoyladenosine dehydratase